MNRKANFLLSPLEEAIYRQLLVSSEPLLIKKVALAINHSIEAVNRSVNVLLEKHFITATKTHPRKIQALSSEFGFFYAWNQLQDGFSTELPLLISNREKYHKIGCSLFSESQKEVLQISSGFGNLDPDYFKIIVDRIKEGVRFRVIVLNYTAENTAMLKSWKQNGFEIKHHPGRDVNVILYDRKTLQLGLRIIEGSREKLGIVIRNESLGEFWAEFFEHLWSESSLI